MGWLFWMSICHMALHSVLPSLAKTPNPLLIGVWQNMGAQKKVNLGKKSGILGNKC